MMDYNGFKCPNCGSNLVINKIQKTGKCQYCGHEVMYNLQDSELTRLIESANAHIKLNDQKVLRKDCNLLYEKYPGNPITYYYLAKADLLEISHLINNKEVAVRCSYLLSSVRVNLIRLKQFNKDNDVDPSSIVEEYNKYVEINNNDLHKMQQEISRSNALATFWFVLLLVITIVLLFTPLFLLGVIMIIIGLANAWPRKYKRKLRKMPKCANNPNFTY